MPSATACADCHHDITRAEPIESGRRDCPATDLDCGCRSAVRFAWAGLILDGKTLLGTAQLLSSGTAGMKLRFGPGAHSLTASFAGSKTYAKSSSGAQSLTVTAALTTGTKLSASGANPYMLTANVTASGLPPLNGLVTFIDQTNTMTLGTVALGTPITTQTFQAQSAYGTGNTPSATAVGDFNGDGIPDLAAANSGDNTVSVLLGKGDGTFQAQATYATGGEPDSAAVGDFNGDGIPIWPLRIRASTTQWACC